MDCNFFSTGLDYFTEFFEKDLRTKFLIVWNAPMKRVEDSYTITSAYSYIAITLKLVVIVIFKQGVDPLSTKAIILYPVLF